MGATLNKAALRSVQIPLPELEEQRRIAAILDQADAIRTKRRQVLSQTTELELAVFRATFNGLGDSPTVPLAEAVNDGTIITYGIVQAGDHVPSGVPYIRTGDIVDGSIVVDRLQRTAQHIADRYARSRVEAGDIVMSIRATVGTTAVVPPQLAGANLTQGTARIAPSERATGAYLLGYLRSTWAQRWLQAQVKGATFREITLKRLRDLPVPLPPAALQEVYKSRVASLSEQRVNLIEALRVDDELFAALQSRAFSGEL